MGVFPSYEQRKDILRYIQKALVAMLHQTDIRLLSEKTGVSEKNIRDIMTWHTLISNYVVLNKLLVGLDTDIVSFMKHVESSDGFPLHYFEGTNASLIQTKSGHLDMRNLRTINARIESIIDMIIPLSTKFYLEHIIAQKRNRIGKRDILDKNTTFQTIYKATRMAAITLSDFFSDRPLKGLVNLHSVKVAPISREEVKKAEQVFSYLLFQEMIEQSLSIQELAVKSRVYPKTIRSLLTGNIPRISSIRDTVEKGLGISLEEFFRDFEKTLKSGHIVVGEAFWPETFRLPYLSEKNTEQFGVCRQTFFARPSIL